MRTSLLVFHENQVRSTFTLLSNLLTLYAEYIGLDEPIFIIGEKGVEKRGKPTEISQAALPTKLKQLIQSSTSKGPSFEVFEPSSLSEISQAGNDDPLSDEFFLRSHQKAERREKHLRNIEKERAQHEKGQLELLLYSLQGPDWLRAMGVSGITDGARKEWEPKREYFVREVRALLDKFRHWRDAEKKMLQEKELANQKAQEDDEEYEYEDEDAAVGVYRDDDDSMLNGPSSSDVDAWAAHQLQQEAKTASRNSRARQGLQIHLSTPKNRPRTSALARPSPPPKPFTSFFEKPHQRAIALGKGIGNRHGARRRNDLVLAFGQPVPEMDVEEFELPGGVFTADFLVMHARKRRRLNREKKEDEK
jgi:hypothetical protein